MLIVNSAFLSQNATEFFGYRSSARAGKRELSTEPQHNMRYSGRF